MLLSIIALLLLIFYQHLGVTYWLFYKDIYIIHQPYKVPKYTKWRELSASSYKQGKFHFWYAHKDEGISIYGCELFYSAIGRFKVHSHYMFIVSVYKALSVCEREACVCALTVCWFVSFNFPQYPINFRSIYSVMPTPSFPY